MYIAIIFVCIVQINFGEIVTISLIDFERADVQSLLRLHLAEADNGAPSHALDMTALQAPDVTMFSLRDDDGHLMGFAALKALSSSEGEIKSVRTDPDHLRKGVSRHLMDHLEAEARARGYQRLLLETHPSKEYEAARALYERRGYIYRGPFGDYVSSPHSVFMELVLSR